MAKYKKILIPGWMDVGRDYVDYDSLEIWRENFPEDFFIDAEYIIGHSLGSHYAVINWSTNKNSKLILVNPLLIKRNFFNWLWRWLKFRVIEGLPKNFQHVKSLKSFFRGAKAFFYYTHIDILKVVENIPKDNLLVIRGRRDKFFCDDEVCRLVESKGFSIVEVEGVGHNWNEKITEEIDKLIN